MTTSQKKVIMNGMFDHHAYIKWITSQIWPNKIPESSSSTVITVNSNARSTPQIPEVGTPGALTEVRVCSLPIFRVPAGALQLPRGSGPKVR